MIKSQIIQQYTRRVLAHSKNGCLFRSLETLADANQPTPSRIQTVTEQKEQWSKQGHQVKPSDVRCLIKNLRDSNQFSKALEVIILDLFHLLIFSVINIAYDTTTFVTCLGIRVDG